MIWVMILAVKELESRHHAFAVSVANKKNQISLKLNNFMIPYYL